MKILLIDDHALFRAGIRHLIQQVHPDADIVETGSAIEGLGLAAADPVDLVFLDLRIPQHPGGEEDVSHGLAALEALRTAESGPPVVVMSGEPTREFVDRVMSLGAASFVPKSAAPGVLFEAIQRPLRGGVFIPSEALGRGGAEPPPRYDFALRPPPVPLTHLDLAITPREFDILRLALQGNAPWKIALILEINATNVRRYLSRLYEKFGVINLYGLQSHFAKTGQVLGIISASSKDPSAV